MCSNAFVKCCVKLASTVVIVAGDEKHSQVLNVFRQQNLCRVLNSLDVLIGVAPVCLSVAEV